MVAPLLAAALPAAVQGLISFVPSIARYLGGEKAGQIADTVVSVAQKITGTDTPDKALEALRANPELVLQFQNQMFAHERAIMENDTARLKEINETYRREIESSDPYVRRMRPTWGYAMALAFTTQMMAITITILIEPSFAAEIIKSVESLSMIWAVGLSVLGVYVYKRSNEKLAGRQGESEGAAGGGLLDMILRRGK